MESVQLLAENIGTRAKCHTPFLRCSTPARRMNHEAHAYFHNVASFALFLSYALLILSFIIAKKLAREYDIELFMRPLLDAAGERKEASSSTPELSQKAATSNDEAASTTSQEEGTVIADLEVVESTTAITTTEKSEEETASVESVVGMKRRIEELEEESVRNKRKIRGLATVAVGLAAATIIPSVLPYFS